MSPKQVARIVVTFLLIASGIWLGRNRPFYTEAVVSIFFACTLTSVSVIHFRIHPSWRDALLFFFGTFLFAVIDFQLLNFRPMFASWFSFAGLSSLVILGVRAVWAEGASRKLLALGFVPALLLVGSEYFASNFLEWTAAAHPKVLDLYLYSFDASLGLQFPFLVALGFASWPSLRVTSLIFYIGLAIPIGLIYVGRLLRLGEKAVPSFVAFLTDRKSTRLNSSHITISYAVFCLKKKTSDVLMSATFFPPIAATRSETPLPIQASPSQTAPASIMLQSYGVSPLTSVPTPIAAITS